MIMPMKRALMLAAAGFFLFIICMVSSAQISTVPLKGLPQNARLAICGDSITEQMIYTRYVEIYLLASAGRNDVSIFQFGWAGETAASFANRIDRGDLDAFKPTAVTFLYGANDCGGMAWQPWMKDMWSGRVKAILDRLAVKYPDTISSTVICSPTFFDLNADASNVESSVRCNEALSKFREISFSIACDSGKGFADIHARMKESGNAARNAIGGDFRFGGRDGVHPGPNGHIMIAHEILKSLGCDGKIAEITVDLDGKSEASAGHRILGFEKGVVRIESSRYPFCWNYDGSKAADRIGSILPYLPFNQELNRFILVVRNLGAAEADVTWGGLTRRFACGELEKGVNLSEKFERTPFDDAFAKVTDLVARKQIRERDMIKAAGDASSPVKGWKDVDISERGRMDREVHESVLPVTHSIVITPLRPK